VSEEAVVEVAGESLHLLPERAAFWPGRDTLFIADTHWGKAASFRAAGLPVPHGTTGDGLERMDSALSLTGARRLLVLGDFLHAREGRVPGTLSALARWREGWPRLEIVLVRGNHDRHAGDPPAELAVRCVDAPLREGPFTFLHQPVRVPGSYAIGGHIHPAVRLVGRGHQRARLPCFWFAAEVGVLPAFGDFTGNGIVNPAAEDRVYVVAGASVLRIGA
jgi:uncharacterized protein